MRDLCRLLLSLAMEREITDIHLERKGKGLHLFFRTDKGLEELDQDIFPPEFLEYLKFLSGMDLCQPNEPQSGEFTMTVYGKKAQCRFSLLHAQDTQTGVIRLLHSARHFALEDLSSCKEAAKRLERFTQTDRGLIISCGPTGSGKSTTIHALLHRILEKRPLKIVTMEDPIEIQEPDMLQIQINPGRGVTYQRTLEELLRQNLDVLFISECRSEIAAKMTVRASLTGHVVYTTLHCGSGLECLLRLLDLGADEQDLRSVLKGIFVCRLLRNGDQKECVYEIWNEEDVHRLFEEKENARPGLSFEACLRPEGDAGSG